jgi:hypothetical protein
MLCYMLHIISIVLIILIKFLILYLYDTNEIKLENNEVYIPNLYV